MDIIAVGIPYIKDRGREVGQGRKADVTHLHRNRGKSGINKKDR